MYKAAHYCLLNCTKNIHETVAVEMSRGLGRVCIISSECSEAKHCVHKSHREQTPKLTVRNIPTNWPKKKCILYAMCSQKAIEQRLHQSAVSVTRLSN